MRWNPLRRINRKIERLEEDFRRQSHILERFEKSQRDLWSAFYALNNYLGVKTDSDFRTTKSRKGKKGE